MAAVVLAAAIVNWIAMYPTWWPNRSSTGHVAAGHDYHTHTIIFKLFVNELELPIVVALASDPSTLPKVTLGVPNGRYFQM